MNIESKLWKIVSLGGIGTAFITQKASNVTRPVPMMTLPSINNLAAMHEKKFDMIMREAFHGERE